MNDKKGKCNKQELCGCSVPEWYWSAGLHDACITSIESQEFEINYSRPAENRIKNVLSFSIDASNALFDSAVKEISFFNYKLCTESIDLNGRKRWFWIGDRIRKLDHDYYHYELQIDLRDLDRDPQVFTVVIRFGNAVVIR